MKRLRKAILLATALLLLAGCDALLDIGSTKSNSGVKGDTSVISAILVPVEDHSFLSVTTIPATSGERELSSIIDKFLARDFSVESLKKESFDTTLRSATPIVVYRQVEKGSIRQMVEYLSSLSENTSPFLTEHQVVEFILANEDELAKMPQQGRQPVFLVKRGDLSFVLTSLGRSIGSTQDLSATLYSIYNDSVNPNPPADPENFDFDEDAPSYHFIVPELK